MSLSQTGHEFDAVLVRKENTALILYLQKEQPSAQADMVELLVKALKWTEVQELHVWQILRTDQ